MSKSVPLVHPACQKKDGRMFYDSTDLNANNFSVDQELFFREIKEEPKDNGDESRDEEFDFEDQANRDDARTNEGQTWFVAIKREACFSKKDDADMCLGNDDKTFTCNYCGRTFKRRDQLIRDLIIHGLVDPFACDLCGKIFNRKDVLQKHIIAMHAFNNRFNNLKTNEKFTNLNNPFPCDVCHKTFKRYDSVKRHKRAHFNERAFVCHLCDMKFTQTSILTRHIRSHTKETPFSCGLCNKKYTRKYILARHIANKHGKKILACYTCDRCDKTFKSEGYLKKHSRQMHK